MAQEIVPFDDAVAAEPLQSIPMTKSKVSEASRPKFDLNYYAECLVKSSKVVDPTKVASSSKAPSQKPHSYECDVCRKTFSSHQALGGHKSSHSANKRSHDDGKNTAKSRKRPHLFMTSSETESASSLLMEEPAEGQIASSSKGPYKCDVCEKTFSSYQSLGGHKSSHYYEKNNRQSNTVKAHKRPEYLQLFPDNLIGQATPATSNHESSSSCLEEDIDLELRL